MHNHIDQQKVVAPKSTKALRSLLILYSQDPNMFATLLGGKSHVDTLITADAAQEKWH
jgi:hypothetical protein